MMDFTRIKEELYEIEEKYLSPYATRSREAIREKDDIEKIGMRPEFSTDADRILHSHAYTRYIDKTQVFSLVPNDHITHRALHVQLVSKIARTIGRILRLNEDLIEAIALGHDIGHSPFGHDGEHYLSLISIKYNLPPFVHAVQSVRNLRIIEKNGNGLNLTLQVLDGILCHDGEIHLKTAKPNRKKDFNTFFQELSIKEKNPKTILNPMTLEGCVVKICDVIAYIGRDLEDAILLGLIKRDDIPPTVKKVLGDTNGKIVYRLVEDLISNSYNKDEISFSDTVSDALFQLKTFNYKMIYKNPKIKTQDSKIKWLFEYLFDTLYEHLQQKDYSSPIFTDFLINMNEEYKINTPHALMVRDYIAGMTDEYFLRVCKELLIPTEFPLYFDKNPS